jgi:hypothetical protein
MAAFNRGCRRGGDGDGASSATVNREGSSRRGEERKLVMEREPFVGTPSAQTLKLDQTLRGNRQER